MVTTPLEWLSEFRVNNSTTDSYYDPDIIQLSNGNVLIAWTTNDSSGVGSPSVLDVVGQIFNPFGDEVGSEFRINRGNTNANCSTCRWLLYPATDLSPPKCRWLVEALHSTPTFILMNSLLTAAT